MSRLGDILRAKKARRPLTEEEIAWGQKLAAEILEREKQA